MKLATITAVFSTVVPAAGGVHAPAPEVRRVVESVAASTSAGQNGGAFHSFCEYIRVWSA